ncbi:non-hydrolyzing UDP-N-acetylglucosamine 2-epimerase [Aeromicrobium chenweiae]|uniref:UDP-N-acetylglucosamine 2-epimerase (non-hydrolyzing) n=1 Tax=Aeromicrobium chenweiae TaxID=2079793 RepID=A0A2S0WJA2_9ACTN|nr:UDP-N-acetylglucosamine 2-epimerase (non-hydrolyzing) [Aeromicrobium chenweiae]AWB91425.1 UDP-N-acetylglucosamine 2-epimerase (non-hydrolyzing) [Aeromicrobium chenweiae]TGN30644.1 UDP-N-acetylglucosamine 2-epimerase (non-hydrolyzing) [Aeromicrobium chenweiae]
MRQRTALVVYGTRPEAIKMAPVVNALERSSVLRPVVAVTGQHREMLDQVNTLFGIVPQHDLDIIRPRQQLHEITSRALDGLTTAIRAESPDVVIVQGDTTTAFVAALAAFYERVPVAHVEAGLRTSDRYNPFPEEINRRLASQLASIHLAPTPTSRSNLLAEGIATEDVFVTGNTVIDALLAVVDRQLPPQNPALSPLMDLGDRKAVLITSHRRESWGEPMACTARAIARLANDFPDALFVLPAHLNPTVREVLLPPLEGLANVMVTEPLGYSDFARAMDASSIMLTDSGGVQEEAPSLGKPVLVLRETTERPEAVDAGTVRLVGTDEDVIVDAVSTLLTDETAYKDMAHAVNPYGDGRAADRIVDAIAHHFGAGPRPGEFVPPGPES